MMSEVQWGLLVGFLSGAIFTFAALALFFYYFSRRMLRNTLSSIPQVQPLDVDAYVEDLARTFHETYERLAPDFGYETRKESAVPWDSVPNQNRNLMRAVIREVFLFCLQQKLPLPKEYD